MRSILNPFSILRLYNALKKIQPDIVHTHSSLDSWQVSFCCKILKIPIVRSRHVSIHMKNFFPKNCIYSYFPDRIITSGKAVQDLIQRLDGVSNEKVISIVAGVDVQRFNYKISGEKFRSELNVLSGQPLIGKIAVIRGWKGHDYFLSAIPPILEIIPNARFVIVGDGPGFEEIKNKISRQNLDLIVTLLGYREDIPEIIAGLDVLTLASTAGEATSQVIPQAFAMKTPVVATKTGGIPEIMGNGERGILVDPRNNLALAKGIIKLLKNPVLSQRFTQKAYKFCLQELTIDRMMDQTITVYEDIIKMRN